MVRFIAVLALLYIATASFAGKLLVPMDAKGQANHLKAYGVVYAAVKEGIAVDWLLNYRGGSFLIDDAGDAEALCNTNGVTVKKLTVAACTRILNEVNAADFNGQVIRLDKAPRIAVYTPLNKEPWDDAVTLALTYAGIPFDKVYADEVLAGDLKQYDWLHLHHEDFTGQYSKFWANFRYTTWYETDQRTMEALAAHHGFKKVSELQTAVVKKIKDFVKDGGNMFAMCTATETLDIALAADGVDICDTPFDGDPPDPFANSKLDYNKCLAFKDFHVVTDPYAPFHSDIDYAALDVPEQYDYFTVVAADARKDPVTAMLCQDHVSTIKGFYGQTTAFREDVLKPGVTILAKNITAKEGSFPYSGYNSHRIKYIHGTYGRGSWTFYGGHDPESYKHMVGSPPTDLSKYTNSPGYRLILNNLLLPAAQKALQASIVNPPVSNKSNNIKMYPDAEREELTISSEPSGEIGNIVITDQKGNEVFTRNFTAPKAIVKMKDFPAGIYQVSVNGHYIGKMAKQ